ncbi:hypothetical protein VPH35_069000 [Triticum aestivum]
MFRWCYNMDSHPGVRRRKNHVPPHPVTLVLAGKWTAYGEACSFRTFIVGMIICTECCASMHYFFGGKVPKNSTSRVILGFVLEKFFHCSPLYSSEKTYTLK